MVSDKASEQGGSPPPAAAAGASVEDHPVGADDTAQDAASRRKRGRDAAYGPATPKSEDENKPFGGGLTPLAKKNRMQPASGSSSLAPGDAPVKEDSDDELVPTADETTTGVRQGQQDAVARDARDDTPPSPGGMTPPQFSQLDGPNTPLQDALAGRLPHDKTEGRETKLIRKKVEALEWEDDQPADTAGEDVDVVDAEPSQEDVDTVDAMSVAASLRGEQSDVETADVAAEVADTAREIQKQDVEIADVAAQVAESAKGVQKQDVEIADVAAQVSDSAGALQKQDEDISDVAAEVSQSAKVVQKEDEDIADVAAEVGTSAAALDKQENGERTPLVFEKKPAEDVSPRSTTKAPSFGDFGGSASPFGKVKAQPAASLDSLSSQVPAKSVSPPPAVKSPTPAPKPTLSAFGGASAPAPAPAAAAQPNPASQFTSSSFSSGFGAAKPSSSFASSSSGSASPFGAFASTSGFASTPKGKSEGLAGAGGAAKSAFGGSGMGFGSYSTAANSASPFARVEKGKEAETDDSASAAESDAETAAAKKVYTEQETITGEEDEETLHSVRGKLFVMLSGNWTERGAGLLNLNAPKDLARSGVMRADQTHRLLLNAPLFKGFETKITQEKYVLLTVVEGNKPMSYMMRCGNPTLAKGFVDAVASAVRELGSEAGTPGGAAAAAAEEGPL